MRTFEQLSAQERESALRTALVVIIESIVFGLVDIELTIPANQRSLEHILDEGRRNDETRLPMLRIMNSKPICQELSKLALVAASESMYDQMGSRILEGQLQ